MTKLLAAIPLALALLGAGGAARADIYKWIDANGVANYTDNPDLAGGARVQMLKTAAAAPATEAGGDWRQREAEFQRRQQHKLMAPGYRPREAGGGAVASANAVHRGGQPETDATRCALARAVIDGAVGHVNDLPVDQHDRDTAANDIRAYCR
jgi:hypothetical protein